MLNPIAYNCSYGCECITSLHECKKAADEIGGVFDSFTVENDPDEPPGCYVYDGDSLYFNSNLTMNAYEHDYDYQMLCISNPDEPHYHGMYYKASELRKS